MIPSLAAWVLRRLVCGHALNGELQAVSGPMRGVVEQLAALPAEARQAALDDIDPFALSPMSDNPAALPKGA